MSTDKDWITLGITEDKISQLLDYLTNEGQESIQLGLILYFDDNTMQVGGKIDVSYKSQVTIGVSSQ